MQEVMLYKKLLFCKNPSDSKSIALNAATIYFSLSFSA